MRAFVRQQGTSRTGSERGQEGCQLHVPGVPAEGLQSQQECPVETTAYLRAGFVHEDKANGRARYMWKMYIQRDTDTGTGRSISKYTPRRDRKIYTWRHMHKEISICRNMCGYVCTKRYIFAEIPVDTYARRDRCLQKYMWICMHKEIHICRNMCGCICTKKYMFAEIHVDTYARRDTCLQKHIGTYIQKDTHEDHTQMVIQELAHAMSMAGLLRVKPAGQVGM